MSIKDQVASYFEGTISNQEDYNMLLSYNKALKKILKNTKSMLAVEARKINRAIGAKDEYIN